MTTREYMASKLHEFRIARDMNVDEVGAAIGKSGKTVSAWEVGRGQPDADKLVELCLLYGVHIQDFYEPTVSDLSDAEVRILGLYRSLNHIGQSVADAVLSALVRSGDYERKEQL